MCSEAKQLASYLYGNLKVMLKSKVLLALNDNIEMYCNGVDNYSVEDEK